MRRFPVDVPKTKAIRTLERLGFRVVREGSHISYGTGKCRWKFNPFDSAESSSYQRFNVTPNLYPIRNFQIGFSGRLHTGVNSCRSEGRTWLTLSPIAASTPRQSM